MGHIRKKGKNSWQIIVSKGKNPVTGKYERIYETVTGNKTKAKERMHELEHEVASGSYVEPSDMTFAELLNQWFEDYAEVNLADNTQATYRIFIDSHIIPALGKVNLDDLQPSHIQSYISEKLKGGRKDGQEGGLSRTSVRKHYVLINQVLQYAVRMQILENNPAKPIQAPSNDVREINPMSQEEVEEVLGAAEGWLYDFIYIAVYTGMRRGEILGLNWKNVDFENSKLYVRQSATVINGNEHVLKDPKTEESKRQVDINDSIANILNERQLQQKKDKLQLAEEYNNEHNLVFAKPDGSPYLPDHATKSFKKLARKLDLGEYRLHDLRHTHATLMLKAGVHPKVVQERLGHASISQTLDTYSHVIPSMQKEAVEKLDEILEI